MRRDLRVVIVDDEPLARDELAFLISECGQTEVVGQAADASEALRVCESQQPDVVFTDLRMTGPDGIALAEALLERTLAKYVVVVSAHDDAAVRAFDARVIDYLLKPVRLERLRQTLDKIGAVSQEATPLASLAPLDRIAVRQRQSYRVIDIDDVVFFEVKDLLVWAVTKVGRFALDMPLATLELRLPPKEFFRSHRAAVVRLRGITKIEPTGAGTFDLVMDLPDSPRVPLARERAKQLRQFIEFAG